MNPPSDTAAVEEVAEAEETATDAAPTPEDDVGFEGDNVTSADDPALLEELLDEDGPEVPEGEDQGEAETPPAEPEPEAAPAEPEPTGEKPPDAAKEPAKLEEAPKPVDSAPAQEATSTPEVPQPVEPEVPQLTPQELAAEFATWRQGAETMLAEQHYNLSEDMVERLTTEPEKAIPELLSRVYIDSFTAALGQMTTNLPGMITAVVARQNEAYNDETKFFERWPKLADHPNDVIRLAQAYRTANPGASTENFIRDVGVQAMMALQIPMEGLPVADASEATPDKPFQPAASQTPARGAPAKRGEFDELADEFEEDADFT